jgi:hypothetical protein
MDAGDAATVVDVKRLDGDAERGAQSFLWCFGWKFANGPNG